MSQSTTLSIFSIPKLNRRLLQAKRDGNRGEEIAIMRILKVAMIENLDAISDVIEKRYKIIDYDYLWQYPEKLDETIREHLRSLCGNTSRTKIAEAMNTSLNRVYRIVGYKSRSLSLPDVEALYRGAYKVTREDTSYFQDPTTFMSELRAFYAERVLSHSPKKVADLLSLKRDVIYRRFWKMRINSTLDTMQDGLRLIKRYEQALKGVSSDGNLSEPIEKDSGLSESRSLLRMELS